MLISIGSGIDPANTAPLGVLGGSRRIRTSFPNRHHGRTAPPVLIPKGPIQSSRPDEGHRCHQFASQLRYRDELTTQIDDRIEKRPGNKPNRPAEILTVLSISPLEEDHISQERLFNRSEWSEDTESRWVLHPMPRLESALRTLRENRISIVVAERDLLPGTWRDVLAEIGTLPDSTAPDRDFPPGR